jgi:Amt family ammonium transporter
MVFVVKSFFGYDDSLDAFGVHGAGGTIGALLTGLFATRIINPIYGSDKTGNLLPTGAFDGHWSQILNQAEGVAIAWSISIVGTLALLFLVDKLVGLRVSLQDEQLGLDQTQHGESGYEYDVP